jgi:hypothetical protein
MSIPTDEEICWTDLEVPSGASYDECVHHYKRDRNFLDENRRLLAHRKKNCECVKCWHEMMGRPPLETKEEALASYKFEERKIERSKKKAKKEVRAGTQATINSFFRAI